MRTIKHIFAIASLVLIPVLSAAQDTTSFYQLDVATSQPMTGQVPVIQGDSTVRMTITMFNQYIIDSLAVVRDSLESLSDTTIIQRTDQNAKIGLDEPDRLTFFDPEAGIDDTDSMVVKSDENVFKITKRSFQYDLVIDIGEANAEIDKLNDSITNLRITLSLLELSSDFDSLRLSINADSIYAYWPSPTGQVIIPWVVGAPQDRTPPTYVSGEIGNYSDTVIVLTFSEFLLGDSIYDYSGAVGVNWTGIDYAANFDQPTGNLIDFINGDNGTNSGAYQLDSAGIAVRSWYFDGSDVVTLGTGTNYGSNDLSGSVFIKPLSLASDFRIYSGETNGFFIGYSASNDGLWVGKTSVDVSAATDLGLTVNVWNHVCWSDDQTANQVTFWVDGVSEVESYSTEFSGVSKYIGSSGGGSYFTGLMDDLFLWDSDKLTQNRVDSLYNSGVGRRYNDSGGSVAINSDTITEAFNATILPLLPGFAVDSVWILGNKVYLDLTDTISYSDIVKFRYTKPTGSGSNMGVRDTSNNYMATIPFLQTVTNNVDTSGVDYEIFEHWDFTGESLGAFDCTDLQNLFGTTQYYNCSYITTPEIVQQTINGVSKNVLKITNDEGLPDPITWYYGGLNYAWDLDSSYRDIYMSYNIMFDPNVCWTPDIKLPGFNPGLVTIGSDMVSGDGFRAQSYAQRGGEKMSYFYVRNYRPGAWSGGTSTIDTFYIVPGVWYSVTLRVRLNDYDDTNGVWEAGYNGGWKNQLLDMQYIEDYGAENNTIAIKNWTGGSGPHNQSDHDWYFYLSDITMWKPYNDNIFGTYALHDKTETFPHPYEITDRDFYYESIISTESTLTNDDWGSPYGSSMAEYHLLDAGAGNQVQIVMNSGGSLGGGDYLFVYDGNTSNATRLGKYNAQTIATGITLQSSGRYMYIYFNSANYAGYGNGWSFDITHIP